MAELVCEIGITHGGSLDKARIITDTAKACGAKVVKFQTFQPEKLYREDDPAKQEIAPLALSFGDFVKLSRHCEDIGVEFMSTPGDVDSLKFLVEECGIKRVKIGSDDLTYTPLLEAAYKTELPVILSTGMASMDEITWAISGAKDLTLLHCVSAYPCDITDVNLRALDALKSFGFPVGYSDHTSDIAACFAAAARGATVIEKHFAPAGYKGPDAEVSAGPNMLRALVIGLETVETMLGTGVKEPTELEKANRVFFRKDKDGKRGLLN